MLEFCCGGRYGPPGYLSAFHIGIKMFNRNIVWFGYMFCLSSLEIGIKCLSKLNIDMIYYDSRILNETKANDLCDKGSI